MTYNLEHCENRVNVNNGHVPWVDYLNFEYLAACRALGSHLLLLKNSQTVK